MGGVNGRALSDHTYDVLMTQMTNRRKRCNPRSLSPQQQQNEIITKVCKQIVESDKPQQGLDLPLDIQGTAFQQRVWQVLQEIPPGITASYSEIAQQIGNPRAVRAVARACASNQIAVAIPCHRVVGSDGSLKGYRWGSNRKQALLDREITKI
jgi:O-6-methylguanine DNA methyltransferase